MRWEIRGWCYRLHELRINFSTFCCGSRTWRLLMDKGSNIFPVAKYKSSVACYYQLPASWQTTPFFFSQPNSVEQVGKHVGGERIFMGDSRGFFCTELVGLLAGKEEWSNSDFVTWKNSWISGEITGFLAKWYHFGERKTRTGTCFFRKVVETIFSSNHRAKLQKTPKTSSIEFR